jgi:hypothetical protein
VLLNGPLDEPKGLTSSLSDGDAAGEIRYMGSEGTVAFLDDHGVLHFFGISIPACLKLLLGVPIGAS